MTDLSSRDSSGRSAPRAGSADAGAGSTAAPAAMSTSTKALIAILLAGVTGLVIFLFASLGGGGTASAKSCQVGQRNCLPDVKYVDTLGVAYTPKTLADKVVVVNFWATWCKPCLKEIPDFSKVYDDYKAKGVVFLGVLMDDPDNQTLLNFQSDNMMSYPVVRANSEILTSYEHPQALPTTFIYDRRGKRAHAHVGPLRADQLAKYIEPLVAAR